MAPVKLNWTVESMKSAQEEVIKTSTLEAWPTCSKSCIASWIATESDEMIKITPKDASGL
jgi:hypothetical protein